MGVAVIVGVLLAELLVLGFWTFRRGVNADEGFYLAASRHVSEGRRLYEDVFFPQMPYLPWLQSTLFAAAAGSLAFGRALSVAAAVLAAGLLTGIAWHRTHDAAAAGFIATLYVFSAVLLNGLSIAKNFAWPNLCLLAAFAPFAVGLVRRPAWAFAAGLAMAAAVGFRLAVAPVAIVLALWAWRFSPRVLAGFVAGATAGSLPWLIVAARSPGEFWFCNVTFHAMRREISGIGPIMAQKLSVAGKWILLPQHLILWGLAALGLWREPGRAWPAAACTAVLLVSSAAATPTYLEYMSQFVPFLLLTALPAIIWLVRSRAAAAAVLGLYLLGLYPALKSAASDEELADKRALWQLGTVRGVSTYLRAHTPADVPVLSWWEGYPVLSDRPGYIGVGFWESNVAKKLAPDAAHRHHVLQQEDVRGLIDRREPSAVVVPDGTWEALRAAILAGYQPAARVGAVQIYLRTGSS